MVSVLGGGAGGTGGLGGAIWGRPAWWLFIAGFVRYFVALQFRVVISAIGRAVVHASVWSRYKHGVGIMVARSGWRSWDSLSVARCNW